MSAMVASSIAKARALETIVVPSVRVIACCHVPVIAWRQPSRAPWCAAASPLVTRPAGDGRRYCPLSARDAVLSAAHGHCPASLGGVLPGFLGSFAACGTRCVLTAH